MSDIFGEAKSFGFGLMRLPIVSGAVKNSQVDIEEFKRMVDLFIEEGFTYFDTALMYNDGESENAVKTALVDRHERSTFTLTDKLHYMYIHSEADRDAVFEGQKKRTGVEYFDYYLVHDINVESIDIYEKYKVFDWLLKKKAAGEVKHIGFSFHDSPELLERVLKEHPEMEFVQLQVNYHDFKSPAIQSEKNLEVANRYGKPVIVMEPVKGGTLINLDEEILNMFRTYSENSSPASWAIRFAASQPGVRMVLSGMSNLKQMEDNLSFMKNFTPLNEKETKIVFKAAQMLENSKAIPCTGCSYCTGGCPMGIPIPKYFSLYNGQKREDPEGKKGWTPQVEYYQNLAIKCGKASECVECGQCESMCPQHLSVISLLKKVADVFE